MKHLFNSIAGGLVALALLAPAGVAFATIYSAGSLLQTGDVKTEHILNGTILDADISGYAKISATKVAPRGTQGTVLLSDGTYIATTTLLTLSTSTGPTFTVNATTSLTATTTINGVTYKWPSSQASAGTSLQNDGTGSLSWANATPAKLTATFTAGEALAAGTIVSLGDGSGATNVAAETNSNNTAGVPAYLVRKFTSAASAAAITQTSVTLANGTGSGNITYAAEAVVFNDSAGTPGTLRCNFGSTSGTIGQGVDAPVSVSNGTPCAISPSTTYWVGIHLTTFTGGDQRYRFGSSGAANYRQSGDASSWGAPTNNLVIDYTYATNISGRVYAAAAGDTTYRMTGLVGITNAACSASGSCTVDVSGFTTATTTLTSNTTYYLGNATGTLSTSAGVNSRKFGTSFGSDGFMVNWDNR
jgi:hypothetical protein